MKIILLCVYFEFFENHDAIFSNSSRKRATDFKMFNNWSVSKSRIFTLHGRV